MDMSEIWCRDSDRRTSLGRSIPCPPALCSMRKIHLQLLVLRTSPRNISPILNPRGLPGKEELSANNQQETEPLCLIFLKKLNPATNHLCKLGSKYCLN
nr:embryonic stem cell-related gene protein-like [Pan troglodytes]